jgi:hypothetical protein
MKERDSPGVLTAQEAWHTGSHASFAWMPVRCLNCVQEIFTNLLPSTWDMCIEGLQKTVFAARSWMWQSRES